MNNVEIVLQIILPLVTTVGTCVIGYCFSKLKQRDKEEAKRIEERAKEEKERIAVANARSEALRAGLLALCRDRILQGYRYYKRNGCISAQDHETMSKLYNAYHALGGNGTITNVWEKIQELPIKEGD